ncbi:MAG: hypothetical protein RLY50_1236 [Actinomycetota bacterium]|jgi:hypothetical protein
MAIRIIRTVCFSLFVAGIPGLIVSSIAGNNEGWVLSIGMVTAVAALVLIAVSAVTAPRRLEVFDDVVAERVENRVRALLEAGADEAEVRALVRDSIDLSRRHG